MIYSTTISGRDVDLMQIRPTDVCIHDIAHQLARIRRFNGATTRGYSVAAHALHVCDIVSRKGGTLAAQLAALHHDSHEYLVGDVSTPVKAAINAIAHNAWHTFEYAVQRQVLDALHLRTAYVASAALIREADLIALATERRDLQPLGEQWECLVGVQADFVNVRHRAELTDELWADMFLARDEELREQMASRLGYEPAAAVGAGA